MRALYKQFGILNMFCPLRPEGNYLFDLAVYEEKTVCKILIELCKAEGWVMMTEVKLNGKTIDKMTPDIARTLPETGKFECKYICPPEKVKKEVREKLGAKFLDWTL